MAHQLSCTYIGCDCPSILHEGSRVFIFCSSHVRFSALKTFCPSQVKRKELHRPYRAFCRHHCTLETAIYMCLIRVVVQHSCKYRIQDLGIMMCCLQLKLRNMEQQLDWVRSERDELAVSSRSHAADLEAHVKESEQALSRLKVTSPRTPVPPYSITLSDET
jgi:hypothetical protein